MQGSYMHRQQKQSESSGHNNICLDLQCNNHCDYKDCFPHKDRAFKDSNIFLQPYNQLNVTTMYFYLFLCWKNWCLISTTLLLSLAKFPQIIMLVNQLSLWGLYQINLTHEDFYHNARGWQPLEILSLEILSSAFHHPPYSPLQALPLNNPQHNSIVSPNYTMGVTYTKTLLEV